MSYRIKASTFAMHRYLDVGPTGIVFCETAALGGKREFAFSQIDCVLMSDQGVLSFQVGNEVFSLPVKQDDPRHRTAIDALLSGIQQSQMPPVLPIRT